MRILCLGDSIMQYNDFSSYPQTGWIQEFSRFFPEETQWLHFARNGRSTKSFISEGRFDVVMAQAEAGDYALIQFAHNDEKISDDTRYTSPEAGGTFRKNLAYFIRSLKEKGVFSVLLTPMARRLFENGHPKNSHGEYPQAVIETALEENVPCIDMTKLTMEYIDKLGDEGSKRLYMNFEKGLYENFPDGKTDNSHLRPDGASAFSRIAAEEITKIDPSFEGYELLRESCMNGTECIFNEVMGNDEDIDDENLIK